MNPTSKNKITGFTLAQPSDDNKENGNEKDFSSEATYHSSISFIRRIGIAVKLPMKSINSAIMIFLRYFASKDINDEDTEHSINDICRCSLFCASKIEETHCRLRDLMNASFKITFGEDTPLPNPNTIEWQKWKQRIIELEGIILQQINFEFNAVHPHEFVLHQCNELKTHSNMAKLCWSICNDCFYLKDIMLCHPPHQIAAATIHIASEILAINGNEHVLKDLNGASATSPIYAPLSSPQSVSIYDGTKETNWWRRFDIEDDDIRRISMLIMDLYESPFVKFKQEKQ